MSQILLGQSCISWATVAHEPTGHSSLQCSAYWGQVKESSTTGRGAVIRCCRVMGMLYSQTEQILHIWRWLKPILQAKMGGTEYCRLAYLMVMRHIARMLLKIKTHFKYYLHPMKCHLQFRSITSKSSKMSDLGYIDRKFRSHSHKLSRLSHNSLMQFSCQVINNKVNRRGNIWVLIIPTGPVGLNVDLSNRRSKPQNPNETLCETKPFSGDPLLIFWSNFGLQIRAGSLCDSTLWPLDNAGGTHYVIALSELIPKMLSVRGNWRCQPPIRRLFGSKISLARTSRRDRLNFAALTF